MMFETKDKKSIHVVLFDFAPSPRAFKGLMLTDLFMKKLKKRIKSNEDNFSFESYNTTQIKEHGNEADIILLTPVCKANKEEIEQLFPDKPIIIIATTDYGLSNIDPVYKELNVYNDKF